METLIGAVMGLVVAFVVVAMYRKGVRDGMNMSRGEAPAPDEPIQIFAKKPEEPAADSAESQYEAFMNYQPKYVEDRHAER